MNSVQTTGLARLLCFLLALCMIKAGDSTNNDVGQTSGAFCNGTAYDPERATCCGGHNITEGVSERMSQCCGLKAYSPLNEICCDSVLHIRPSPTAECCEKEVFEGNKQLCCGQHESMMVVERLSPDHECCKGRQFNLRFECCCPLKNPVIQLRHNQTHCCEKNLTFDTRPAPAATHSEVFRNTNPNGVEGKENQTIPLNQKVVCCKSKDQSEVYSEKAGFKCCGHYYYNASLWSCCSGTLIPVQTPGQDLCPEEPKLLIKDLNKAKDCNNMFVGIVDRVSQEGVVFTSVLRIHNEKFKLLAKDLTIPKLFESVRPGEIYVFTDTGGDMRKLKQRRVLQLLHSSLSSCSQ